MTNPLVTTDEVKQADLLATVEGAEYRAVSVVYRLNGKSDATFYCSARDWPQTEAGRMARYIAEIEQLRARITKLETSIALSPTQVLEIVPVPDLTCPHCPERGPFKRMNAKMAHMRIVHKEKP